MLHIYPPFNFRSENQTPQPPHSTKGSEAQPFQTHTFLYHPILVSSLHRYEYFRLMESIPIIKEEKERLASIPGTVPSAANFPPGCRFADRCPLTEDVCREMMPELRELRPNHFVRCHLAK